MCASFCLSSRYRLHTHGRRKAILTSLARATVSPFHSCILSDSSHKTAGVSLIFRSLPLPNVHNHSGLAGFGSNGSGPEQGRVPHCLQPNGARPLVHLHRGTDPPDCPTLAVIDEKPPLLGAISHPDAMQVCTESSFAVVPLIHGTFHRKASQAFLDPD